MTDVSDMTIFAKISAKLYLNVKVRTFAAAHPSAAFLWVLAITYSVDRRSDGFVEEFAMRTFLSGTDDDITALCDAGFLDACDGGWRIHDYLDCQTSCAQQDAIRQKRAAAGRKGGMKTASSKREASVQANAEASAQANAKQVLEQTGSKHQAEIEIETEIEIPPYSPPTGDVDEMDSKTDDFETAWDAYPKHTGKTKAKSAWCKTVTEVDPSKLVDAINAYAASRRAPDASDERWTPTMANWLEHGEWRDWIGKGKSGTVRLPDDAWLARYFDQPLFDAGVEYLTVMRLHPKVNDLVRQGRTWVQAADEVSMGVMTMGAHT